MRPSVINSPAKMVLKPTVPGSPQRKAQVMLIQGYVRMRFDRTLTKIDAEAVAEYTQDMVPPITSSSDARLKEVFQIIDFARLVNAPGTPGSSSSSSSSVGGGGADR